MKETGIIESREVKDIQGTGAYSGQTSQKITLKVNKKTFSQFSNSRDLSADAAERLGVVKQGDEVEITFIEKPGEWNGKPVTHRNITDIMKVIRTDGGTEVAPAVQPVGHDKPKPAGDSRDDMMRLSYAKDTVNAIMTRGHINPAEGETEELFIARVFSLIKAGAKTLGE